MGETIEAVDETVEPGMDEMDDETSDDDRTVDDDESGDEYADDPEGVEA